MVYIITKSLNKVKHSDVLKLLAKDKYLLILLAPVVIHTLVFSYLPMYGIVIAFKDFRIDLGILGSPWIGFKYFRTFFESVYAWRIIRNTLIINLMGIMIGVPVSIIFALCLSEVKAMLFKRFVQTVSYFPYFISIVIMVSLLMNILNPVDGLSAYISRITGTDAINYMTSPAYYRWIYVLSDVWKGFGWSSIILLGAIAGIDPQLYECAQIDGISRIGKMFRITFPLILPTIIILQILNIGYLLSSNGEKAILMLTGLTMDVGDVIGSYVYRTGIVEGQFSTSTAVGLFFNVLNFLLLYFANTTSKKVTKVSLW